MFGFRHHGRAQVVASRNPPAPPQRGPEEEQDNPAGETAQQLTAVVSLYTILWQEEKGAQELQNGCLTHNRTLSLTSPGHRET